MTPQVGTAQQTAPASAEPRTSSPKTATTRDDEKPLADPRYPFAERLKGLRGVKNVARIAPEIYRGNAPGDEGLATLKAMGIKTVVNLRHHHGKGEEKACREVGLRYVRIVLESSDAPTDEAVRVFLRTVNDPDLQPVYFHCWRGKDRTGAMAAVYRMTVDAWPLKAALAEMDEFGFYYGWHDLLAFVRGFPARRGEFWPLDPAVGRVAEEASPE
jgi:hypothetical protein